MNGERRHWQYVLAAIAVAIFLGVSFFVVWHFVSVREVPSRPVAPPPSPPSIPPTPTTEPIKDAPFVPPLSVSAPRDPEPVTTLPPPVLVDEPDYALEPVQEVKERVAKVEKTLSQTEEQFREDADDLDLGK